MRIGILSFSDGRERVHRDLKPEINKSLESLISFLQTKNGFDIIKGSEIIYTPELARKEAKKILSKGIDSLIFNIPVFAFPNFALISARICQMAPLIYSPANGKLPGLGGVLAAAGSLKQIGMKSEKVWGDLAESKVQKKILSFLRASSVINRLKGQVYGLIGGRSIGMATGTIDPAQWMKLFGVDVEHVDQLEIIRLADAMPDEEVKKIYDWFTKNLGRIHFGGKLTEETLKYQLKCYLATEKIVKQRGLDFIGVKCHYELSEYYVTQCVSCTLFNDPYDHRGPKSPTVFSCEADSDGALTMQILKMLSNSPSSLLDLRHYDSKHKLYVLANCGSLASWFAERSNIPSENLKKVSLFPLIPKYCGDGAHVQLKCKEGEVTFARLIRDNGQYEMAIFRGEFIDVPMKRLKETCLQWPHAYARVDIEPPDLIDAYFSNHCHVVYGDYTDELLKICELLDFHGNLLQWGVTSQCSKS